MPSAGSVSDIGTSLLRVAAVTGLFAAGVAAFVLLLRAMTGQLHIERQARQRLAEQQRRAALPAPGPAGTPARRRAAGHHPVGRRTPGARLAETVSVPPRRPLQLVAADVRRLARELAMVPGGMPMARRRGLLAAFDDVLVEAAELLQVPHQLTAEPPATRELERVRLLASLEAAGLVVSD